MIRRPSAPSAAELHRRWLELVDTDGPFLAVPALKRVWPQGVPQLPQPSRAALSDAKSAFEHAWDAWDKHSGEPTLAETLRSARDVWAEVVLREVIGWSEDLHFDLRHPGGYCQRFVTEPRRDRGSGLGSGPRGGSRGLGLPSGPL